MTYTSSTSTFIGRATVNTNACPRKSVVQITWEILAVICAFIGVAGLGTIFFGGAVAHSWVATGLGITVAVFGWLGFRGCSSHVPHN